VCQPGQSPPAGLTTRLELALRDQHRGDETGRQQVPTHGDCGGGEEPAAVADPRRQALPLVDAGRGDQRHHADPGFEPGQAQHQQREGQQCGADQAEPTAAANIGQGCGPRRPRVGVGDHLDQRRDDDQRVEDEEHRHERDGHVDRLAEPEKEHPAQYEYQRHGQHHLVAVQEAREVGVLHHVYRGVGGGQGDRDDPGGGDEAEQHEYEQFAPPERQQPFQHRDRAGAVGAFLGHAPVHRQDSEEGQCHDQQRGQW
jgi:hypothetical protein